MTAGCPLRSEAEIAKCLATNSRVCGLPANLGFQAVSLLMPDLVDCEILDLHP